MIVGWEDSEDITSLQESLIAEAIQWERRHRLITAFEPFTLPIIKHISIIFVMAG